MSERLPPRALIGRWVPALLWLGFLYALVPYGRVIQSLVERTTPHGRSSFSDAVYAMAAILVSGSVIHIFRSRHTTRMPRAIAGVAIALLYAGATYLLRRNPEEAIHLVQYGVLALLVFYGLAASMRDRMIYPCTLVLCSIAGAVEEVIQWLAPDRAFDFRDIGINATGSTLMVAGLALGLRPSFVQPGVELRSVRMFGRLLILAVLLTLLLFCNSQHALQRFRVWIPWLERNTEVMTEFGYRHVIPEIGSFRSRLTLDALMHADRERGAGVGAVLNAYADPAHYRARFEQRHPSCTDPFLHEAGVRLFSLSQDYARSVNPRKSERERQVCRMQAFGELQLMERVFSNTLAHAMAYGLTPDVRRSLREGPRADVPFESRVSRDLITAIPANVLRAGTLCVLLSLLAADRLLARRIAAQGRG